MEQAPSADLRTLGPESTRVRLVILMLTAIVFLAITVVIYLLPARSGAGPSVLASLNAFLNAAATVCLLSGFWAIKQKRVRWHRRSMLSAFGLSSAFLVTYLLHHAQVGSVPFKGQGAIRAVYFGLLVPHILLAALVVPLALLTIYRGWTNRVALHRRIA